MVHDISEFYPANPINVPDGLTKPTLRYRLQAVLVMASLLLFLLIYMSLIVGLGGLSLVMLTLLLDAEVLADYSAGSGALMTMLFASVGILSGLLALYFVKGLFKFRRSDDQRHIEIVEADQPRLFAFVRQVCKDTRSQMPAEIVLSPEVNAGVFYTCNFWSLFLSVRKKLHIGMGLVNCLNISEFKAVLAHEFGHFSQRSMRLGTYVYTTNRIIREIILGRDWLDESLSFADPVLNVIRWCMGQMFRIINFAHSSLMRQMEFHADLVAVSVSGSDAIVHGLLRSDFGQQCLDQACQDLSGAADHGLFSSDLFFHQNQSAQYLRILKDEPALGLPPALPDASAEGVQVFPPNETVLPAMWASHPPHFERERNCKKMYVRSPQDNRSAWELFHTPDELRRLLTVHYYENKRIKQEIKARSAAQVQRFIDDEHEETIYSARYHGMYEEGSIAPGNIDSLMRHVPSRYEQPARLLREHAAIFSCNLKERLASYRARRKDQQRLLRFVNKVELPKGGKFQFQGASYRTSEAAKLLELLEQEIKADRDHLAGLDRRIFLIYMGMAGQLGAATARELEERYRFHLGVQDIINALVYRQRQIEEAMAGVVNQRKPNPNAVQAMALALGQAHEEMGRQLAAASYLRLPALRNLRSGVPLTHFLDNKPVVHGLFVTEQIVNGTWINQILHRHAEVIDKLRRVLFKSLGSLICFQERVGEKWKAAYANAPAVGAVSREMALPVAK